MPEATGVPQDDECAIDIQGDASAEPPEIVPPKTKAPVQFNQQNNFYQQIPSNAWDRLNSEQIVELSKKVLDHANEIDKRNYDFAIKRVDIDEKRGRRNLYIGAIVAVAGIIVSGYLSVQGHELVATTISLPLATIIAILVGNRFLS